MKKVLGIIFIILGLVGIIGGIVGFQEHTKYHNRFENRLGRTIDSKYNADYEQQKTGMIVVIGLGGVFLISGFRLVSAKSKSQKKMESELLKMKYKEEFREVAKEAKASVKPRSTPPPYIPKPEQKMEDKLAQIEKLGELKEKGLLTDEEFASQKKKLLES